MIEVLYYDICGLYGDYGNIIFLAKTFGTDKIIYTSIQDKPYFLDNKVSLVYMGSMTEDNQELVIGKLLKYRDNISKIMDSGVSFLFTGNALEIFGKKIVDDDREIKGLGILDVIAVRNMKKRSNCHYMGLYNDIKILGFKSEFAFEYSKEAKLFDTLLGFGFNKDVLEEGLRYRNVYGTNILGPLLPLNPHFAKYLFSTIGYNKHLPYEKELIDAYNFRLEEYEALKKKVMN